MKLRREIQKPKKSMTSHTSGRETYYDKLRIMIIINFLATLKYISHRCVVLLKILPDMQYISILVMHL